jgi:hypothetical protein
MVFPGRSEVAAIHHPCHGGRSQWQAAETSASWPGSGSNIFTKDGFFPSGCVLLFFFWGVGWRPGGSRKVFFFSVGIPLGRVYRSRSEGNGQIVYNSEICHNFNYQGLVYRHRQIDSDRRMDHRGSAARAWKMRSETECQDLATPQSNQSWHAFWDSYVDVIIVSPGGTGTLLFF